MLYFLQQKLTETTLFGLKRVESGRNPQCSWRYQYLCSRMNKGRDKNRPKGNGRVNDWNENGYDRKEEQIVFARAMNEIVTTY